MHTNKANALKCIDTFIDYEAEYNLWPLHK